MTRVILFGATGTIGQGCLRELLQDAEISSVLAVARKATGRESPKLKEIITSNPGELAQVASELKTVDACLYCLGISAAGMTEADYTSVTKTLTLKVLDQLLAENPAMRFLFVSGQGSDAKARAMWARVKGETENEVLARARENAVLFRPGLVEPLHGIQGQNSFAYKMMYAMAPMLRGLGAPVTNTEALGRAMVAVAKKGSPKQILENSDIMQLAKQAKA